MRKDITNLNGQNKLLFSYYKMFSEKLFVHVYVRTFFAFIYTNYILLLQIYEKCYFMLFANVVENALKNNAKYYILKYPKIILLVRFLFKKMTQKYN